MKIDPWFIFSLTFDLKKKSKSLQIAVTKFTYAKLNKLNQDMGQGG